MKVKRTNFIKVNYIHINFVIVYAICKTEGAGRYVLGDQPVPTHENTHISIYTTKYFFKERS